MKLNKNNKFFALLEVLPDNTVKVTKAQKYTRVNQFKTYWKQIPSREFARAVSQSELVTR